MREPDEAREQMLRDIRRLKDRIAELETARERHGEAEDRARLATRVFENTLEGILVTDPQGVIVFVNPAFSSITGYTEREAMGKTPRILKSNRHDAAFYTRMWESLGSSGQWKGEIWNRRKDGEAYLEWLSISAIQGEHGATTHYVAVFSDLTERERSQIAIRHRAYHDALTGLPNRLLFGDRLALALAQATRYGRMLAVMFLDLDHFKEINDSLGHPTGDRLLQLAAERLAGAVRGEDTVARFGGDEFMLLTPHVTQIDDAATVARKLLETLRSPFEWDGRALTISASIGVSLFPLHGRDPETLVRLADEAMYAAKRSGGNRHEICPHPDVVSRVAPAP